MSRLLLDEHPLVVLPSLAVAFESVDEAIIFQQLHYELTQGRGKNNVIDGRSWFYHSVKQWREEVFPWIKSDKTLNKFLNDLERRGLVLTANYNKVGFDRTKWYSIDYDRFTKWENALGKNYQMDSVKNTKCIGQKLPNGLGKNYLTNTKDLNKTNKETEEKNNSSLPKKQKEHIPYKQIVDYLNQKTGKHFKATTAANRKLIKARWNEGYRLEDFKKVISNKCNSWSGVIFSNGKHAEDYLQPSTLFGNKFDQYLNEKTTEPSIQNDDGWKVAKAEDLKEGWDDGLPF